jgi:hypothetical protein
MRRLLKASAVLLALLAGFGGRAADRKSAPAKIEFNRDIRPLLSDRCFKCHGPDQASRKAKLRLDRAEDAYAERKSQGHAIVPSHPESSLVCQRIFDTDPEQMMPPPDSHLALKPAEKEMIRQWITEGAVYKPHWAFIPPPDAVAVPDVKSRKWPRNEIDRFILARLETEGLKPSAEADKSRWLRRVTYDLTGLPPNPEEVTAFLRDKSAGAYEKVVDRLLASSHFGERMAVPWLDAARYADSYGYQSDLLCPTWPYRDWVVKAFNRNLSYDQFLREQLAGDLLPNPTREQRLATAFNRLHRQTNEGGSIEEEWRNEYVSDRVHTFSTTFLALTFECARCHDHKYDPILQRDYYSLSAFFNSIDEWGLYNDALRIPTPSLLLPNPKQEAAMTATEQALKAKTKRLGQAIAEAEPAFQEWFKTNAVAGDLPGRANSATAAGTTRIGRSADIPVRSNVREEAGQRAFSEAGLGSGVAADRYVRAPTATSNAEIPGLVARYSVDALAKPDRLTNELNVLDFSTELHGNSLVPGKTGQAVQFNGDDEITFPKLGGSWQPWDQYSVVFWLELPATLTNGVIFHRCEGYDSGYYGTELSLDQGRLFFAIKRFWPGNAIAIRSSETLPSDQWVQVGVSYDASGTAQGMALFLNGQPMKCDTERNHLFKSPENAKTGLSFGARIRSYGLKDGRLNELLAYNRPLAPLEMRQLFDGHALTDALTNKDAPALRPYYLAALAGSVARARDERAEALKAYLEARNPVQETSVMEELSEPRPAYVLARGRYDAPKTEAQRVARSTPAMLPVFPANAPTNRLGLAQWLADPRHPLTARVAVNRFWQMLFGRGIVATTENFGLQGSQPTHPELLDWLARDFINSGWDVKATLKKIVLSAAYRQNSVLRPELRAKDPENLLLARGPSQRLPAEMIRDTALAASGLLRESLGGPAVNPYMPGDLWRESNNFSPAYKQSPGDDIYRRSVYTVWKRTAPMPNMAAFDAPSREVCVVKRSNTGTPQQGFVLLNDTQFVEAARVLAEKTLHEGGRAPEQRIHFAFRRLTAREPDRREMRLLRQLFEEQKKLFAKEPDRAAKLVAVGDRKRDPALDPVELAATTALTQTILNLDATVWKR